MSEQVIFDKAPLELDEQKEAETIEAVQQGFKGMVDFHRVRAEDIIMLTARLAQLLAEEADHLEQMQVSKIAALQKEKLLLTNALELIKKKLPKDGSFQAALSEEERADLQNVVTVFNEILEENYARLNMARMVNQRIVEAVTEAVKEQSGQEAYDEKGNAGASQKGPMAVSVDAKI